MKKYNLLFIALSIIAASCNQKPQKIANDNAIVEGNDTTMEKDTIKKVEEVKKANPEVDGVDLGLSVNWATHNVGASAPHKVGYLIPLGNVTGTKKSAKHHYEEVSGASDIATVKMGKEWQPNDVGTMGWYWCGKPLEYRNCLYFKLSKGGNMVETAMMIADTETFCNAVRAVKNK